MNSAIRLFIKLSTCSKVPRKYYPLSYQKCPLTALKKRYFPNGAEMIYCWSSANCANKARLTPPNAIPLIVQHLFPFLGNYFKMPLFGGQLQFIPAVKLFFTGDRVKQKIAFSLGPKIGGFGDHPRKVLEPNSREILRSKYPMPYVSKFYIYQDWNSLALKKLSMV